MSDFQVTASCTAASSDGASLDGIVSITVDGATSAYEGLADGTAEFSVPGPDVSFIVVADVQCDTSEPGVSYEAIGVGTAPVPTPQVEVVPVTYSLPATGIDGGGLAGLALLAVVAGVVLMRIARRTAA